MAQGETHIRQQLGHNYEEARVGCVIGPHHFLRSASAPDENRTAYRGGHFELTDDEQNRERLVMRGGPNLSPTTNQLRQREELAVAPPNHESEIPQKEQTDCNRATKEMKGSALRWPLFCRA